jgi:hypothetical protein
MNFRTVSCDGKTGTALLARKQGQHLYLRLLIKWTSWKSSSPGDTCTPPEFPSSMCRITKKATLSDIVLASLSLSILGSRASGAEEAWKLPRLLANSL